MIQFDDDDEVSDHGGGADDGIDAWMRRGGEEGEERVEGSMEV
jgi:hypothetical protein